jgi:hypothetical protein
LIVAVAVYCGSRFGHLLRFFAGFCLIANGAYIAAGSFQSIGDAGDLLHHGTPIWMLWLFGIVTIPAGLLMWNGLGKHFGLGGTWQRGRAKCLHCNNFVCSNNGNRVGAFADPLNQWTLSKRNPTSCVANKLSSVSRPQSLPISTRRWSRRRFARTSRRRRSRANSAASGLSLIDACHAAAGILTAPGDRRPW